MKYFILLLFLQAELEAWTHLELGAGNYGKDGYSQESQIRVIQKLSVSDKPHYVDRLPEKGYGNYDPYDQYAVLFWTLDQLVKRYGEEGIFIVNDIHPSYAEEAKTQLQKYSELKGYNKISIEALAIDYLKIGSLYDTVHLKNPEVSLFNDKMDGDNFSATEASRQAGRTLLQKLANLSKSGLYLFTLYDYPFFPDSEKREFVDKGLFYHEAADWDAVPYIFPRGQILSKDNAKVFHINGTQN